ncbi:MAG: glutamate--cysteine ligase [Arenicellales bacterium]|nr:glutamate--cysteine ligase [Arenicellales bacterium]
MYDLFENRLARLLESGQDDLLAGGKKGVEKESLRVTQDGSIAQTPHPLALGSALTHPYITTDYSEALLEFITPPCTDVRSVREFLSQIHKYVYSKLDDELLWATSMPCLIADEHSIPIAFYGTSNVGTMKNVYRRGLGYRYGRTMQAIAGVHFNYSLPENLWPLFQEVVGDSRELQQFISDSYFCLIRNFQRLGWVIPYLFGASPAVCKSFFSNGPDWLEDFDQHTYFNRYATSLRMSDIGYKNQVQENLDISYNNLEDYVRGLTRAIETPFPEYEKTGVVVNGEHLQLNANVLQIENEYYSFVRPKQVAQSGEKPTLALKRRGVQYVEIRALDVDLFDPVGVNENQMRFMEMFLIFCLLQESPPISTDEQKKIDHNQQTVACCGRTPSLKLLRNSTQVLLQQWANEIYQAMLPVAEILDQSEEGSPYSKALGAEFSAIEDPEQTPSARLLEDMRRNEQSFFHYAMDVCEQHNEYFQRLDMPPERVTFFEKEARVSIQRQKEIESADQISFEEYLERYFAQQ